MILKQPLKFLVQLSVLLTAVSGATGATSTTTTGKPHSTVQILTEANFDDAINDPANGLWLLKFYAPWCGHCKKLAPTLDAMAAYISGKFAIGKIDCTQEVGVCKSNTFNIKGYPTLKIYKDGNFFDYAGKRDADSMITFMEKMSLPSVNLISSFDEFMDKYHGTSSDDNGDGDDEGKDTSNDNSVVAYLAFDPKAKEKETDPNNTNSNDSNDNNEGKKKLNSADVTPVEKILSSTNFLQIYGQNARILQSTTSFALLHPKQKGEIAKFFDSSLTSSSTKVEFNKKILNGPLLLRLEKNAAPMIYTNDHTSSTDVISWMKEHYMPLVTNLVGTNFRTVSSLGKPLLIGVVNPDDRDPTNRANTKQFTQSLREMAQYGPQHIIQKYKFTQMNGKKFHSFLAQFNISTTTSKLPQVIIVNVQNRTFYQDESFGADVTTFIEGVENGMVVEQIQPERNGNDILKSISSWFSNNRYLGLTIVLFIFGLFCFIAITISSSSSDDDYESDANVHDVKVNGKRVLLTEGQLKQLQKHHATKEKKGRNKTLKED